MSSKNIEIIARLEKSPAQGIRALVDTVYLYNPDAVNELIDMLNEVINKVDVGNYNSLEGKPNLDTSSEVSLLPEDSEVIKGTVKLHKISKTGSYLDLLNKPDFDGLKDTTEDLQRQITENADNISTLRADNDELGDQVSVIESKIPGSASDTNQLVTEQQLENEAQDIRSEFASADSEIQQQVNAHATAITGLEDDVEAIESKIPATASQENLLATTSQLNANIQDVRSDYMEADSELQQQLNAHADEITSIEDDITSINSKISFQASSSNKLVSLSEVEAIEQDIRSDMNGSDSELQTQITAQAESLTALKNNVDDLGDQVSAIESKIPSAATSSNQLADKAFVNSSINNMAAFYLTYNATGDAFPTKAALEAGPYYFQGDLRTPTLNDYAIVIEDETQNNASSRYMYDGVQWDFQYTINNTPFTQEQVDALNSTITAGLVSTYNAHVASRANPHNVTKSQVGLANVDNTSDMSKPVSTATKAALDLKADKSTTYTKTEVNDVINDSLTDYVKNTDYATGTVGGVVKVTGNHGLAVYQGMLLGSAKTLDSYNASANNLVMAKGTLENIKDDYVKRGLTENALTFTDEEKAKARTLIGASRVIIRKWS